MAGIKDRINKIKDYFVGMNVSDQIIYVTIRLPENWFIVDGLGEKYGIQIVEEDSGDFVFGAELSDGFDVLFNAIDENILVMKLAEERQVIFKQKQSELKALFDDPSITVDALRTLEFTMKAKRSASKQKAVFQEKDEQVDDAVDNNEEKNETVECQAQ